MKYTVLWRPAAERELASLWTGAEDRDAVRSAADTIDVLLRSNPTTRGESRSGSTRIVFEGPLVATFRVVKPDRTVHVLAVWRNPRRS